MASDHKQKEDHESWLSFVRHLKSRGQDQGHRGQAVSRKLHAAAKIVHEGAHETLSYYAFPQPHWRHLRTNNPLERIMKEIRRRTRVVGSLPGGESC